MRLRTEAEANRVALQEAREAAQREAKEQTQRLEEEKIQLASADAAQQPIAAGTKTATHLRCDFMGSQPGGAALDEG